MEDNLKLPAYPLSIALHNNGTLNTTLDVDTASVGFTKLELAALMIAGNIGVKVDDIGVTEQQLKLISEVSVAIAKAVLEEANK